MNKLFHALLALITAQLTIYQMIVKLAERDANSGRVDITAETLEFQKQLLDALETLRSYGKPNK